MELNVDIKQLNVQVVEIERLEQDVLVQTMREIVEISPSYVRQQDIINNITEEYITNEYITEITKSWFVINIDKENSTHYYIQFKLDGEDQYKIQRIHKINYSIGWNVDEVNNWTIRTTLNYE